MRVLLASNNPHKAAEFRRIFAGTIVELTLPRELGLAALDVPEEGHTFAENATTKALAYLQAYRIPVLADDSGICVDALAGAPGVRSARFGGPDLDDAGRMRYLLRCMATVPEPRRGAHYVCALVLARPDRPPLLAEGACYGAVATEEQPGTTGFGYDPIFLLPGLGTVFARVAPEEKDALSHRGKAARRLLAMLHGAGTP
jgi:XTP/dITP diphosphohydrolase